MQHSRLLCCWAQLLGPQNTITLLLLRLLLLLLSLLLLLLLLLPGMLATLSHRCCL
jgi:hypothetical protein